MDMIGLLEDIKVAVDDATPLLVTTGIIPESHAKLTLVLGRLVVASLKAYEEHTGIPYDLSQLPNEDTV